MTARLEVQGLVVLVGKGSMPSRAPSSRPCSMPCTLSSCIFEVSTEGTSCQTMKRKPWKQALSMASTVLDVLPRIVAVGLEAEQAPLEVGHDEPRPSRKWLETVLGSFQAQERRLSRGTDLAAKHVSTRT